MIELFIFKMIFWLGVYYIFFKLKENKAKRQK